MQQACSMQTEMVGQVMNVAYNMYWCVRKRVPSNAYTMFNDAATSMPVYAILCMFQKHVETMATCCHLNLGRVRYCFKLNIPSYISIFEIIRLLVLSYSQATPDYGEP